MTNAEKLLEFNTVALKFKMKKLKFSVRNFPFPLVSFRVLGIIMFHFKNLKIFIHCLKKNDIFNRKNFLNLYVKYLIHLLNIFLINLM